MRQRVLLNGPDRREGGVRRWLAQVNTRLQVEHGITEYVSRQDLVQWMLQLQVPPLPPLPTSAAVRHDC